MEDGECENGIRPVEEDHENESDNSTSSEEKQQRLRKILKEKDVDQSGTIDLEEFKECLPLMDCYTTDEDAEFLAKHFDTNRDGKLRIEEILENLHILENHSVKASELKEAFHLIDRDNNGYIRQRELLKILIHNDFMTVPEARQLFHDLIKLYDKDGDGRFNYTEFVEMFQSKTYQEAIAPALVQYQST